ncbi:MAG TPA: type VI secretion system ATPase TssH [Gammaproteobacteria bacterium]|nr:type VI secretion system ATPase TssH [Gammaproteobacteria bacterium]
MANLNLKNLIQTLNFICQQTLEAAAGACVSASHYNVEIEHWILKLLNTPHSDIVLIAAHYGLNSKRLIQELTQSLSRLKTGNAQAPALSQRLIDLIREALLAAQLEFNATHIRSAYLLYALLSEQSLNRVFSNIVSEFAKIKIDNFRQELSAIVENSIEQTYQNPTLEETQTLTSSTSALDQYTINLTQLAQSEKIDPVLGRDEEIRQVMDILMRRRQNNPILIGEPGVGKTAIVEGLALRIKQGEVPPALRNVTVRTLDLGLLQAGAGIKGEFENRLKAVIQEVKTASQPVILFVDEAHTLVGAGAAAGQNDCANLLKPALARGELRTIAATTWSEYKKYFEQDAALTRRFQVVKVEEPSAETTITMLHGLCAHLEQHHGVRILDEAIRTAVYLSSRYIADRQLPDKAISVLDTACARLAIRDTSHSPAIENYQSQLQQLATEIAVLTREEKSGAAHQERLVKLRHHEQQYQRSLHALKTRFEQEKKLINAIRATRLQLEEKSTEVSEVSQSNDARTTLYKQLKKLTTQLKKLQKDAPLLQDCVDAQAIAEIISAWTGIPLGKMLKDEIRTLLDLTPRLQQRIKGQTHALSAIVKRIHTARAELVDPRKPIGTFLFVGPSGVGKTETALVLAEILYGGAQNMSVINLSEFKEEHKVSLLMGSPPGYVGYGEGGVLTEAVRKRPYSLVLLDEIEKAHPGVQDIFYQVFDKGMLRDGQGRDINFKNTLMILTSNVGSDLITELCADVDNLPDIEALQQALQPELAKFFKPAFLGRVTLVPYLPLSDKLMHEIIELQLQHIKERVMKQYSATLTYAKSVVSHIASRCKEVQTGARNIDHLLTGSLLPELSVYFLTQLAEKRKIKTVHVGIDERQQFVYAYESV